MALAISLRIWWVGLLYRERVSANCCWLVQALSIVLQSSPGSAEILWHWYCGPTNCTLDCQKQQRLASLLLSPISPGLLESGCHVLSWLDETTEWLQFALFIHGQWIWNVHVLLGLKWLVKWVRKISFSLFLKLDTAKINLVMAGNSLI